MRLLQISLKDTIKKSSDEKPIRLGKGRKPQEHLDCSHSVTNLI